MPGTLSLAHTVLGHVAESWTFRASLSGSHTTLGPEMVWQAEGGMAIGAEKLLVLAAGFDVNKCETPGLGETDSGTHPGPPTPESRLGWGLGKGTFKKLPRSFQGLEPLLQGRRLGRGN